jgi:adenosylcobinamide-phosphate synthase
MSVALALLAMLLELCLGYPQRLTAAIGHPVTWIGGLIGALDRVLNRDPPPFPPQQAGEEKEGARRAAGIIALFVVLAIVGSIAFIIEHALLYLPFGIFVVALIASTLIAQRSLYRHVADVAAALETGDLTLSRAAVSHIVGRDTAALDAAGVARAAIESLAENFSDAVVVPVARSTRPSIPPTA